MGSSPSSGNKVFVGVEQIMTPETQHKQNQEFKSSVQQMKFSKNNDIFKQKSDQTQMQLRNALKNLKRNQLLSTGQFKKLHKTQVMIKEKPQKTQITIKAQRYQYKPNKNKFSQNNLTIKKKQQSSNSKHISSVSSTYIHEGKESSQLNQKQFPNNLSTNPSVEAQVINHLLNRKKNVNSQNSNRQYRNVLENNEAQVIVDFETKYENGKSGDVKKKSKYIKSEKFIPLKLGVMNEQEIPEYSFDNQQKSP